MILNRLLIHLFMEYTFIGLHLFHAEKSLTDLPNGPIPHNHHDYSGLLLVMNAYGVVVVFNGAMQNWYIQLLNNSTENLLICGHLGCPQRRGK